MANPFPFTAGQVLTAAQMNGIGEWVSFTPTWTGYTRGNGTSSARYARVNEFYVFWVVEVLGSTSSVSGLLTLTLPVAASNIAFIQTTGVFSDTGTGASIATPLTTATTTVEFYATNAASTYANVTATSATIPFTWAASDQIRVGGWVQAG